MEESFQQAAAHFGGKKASSGPLLTSAGRCLVPLLTDKLGPFATETCAHAGLDPPRIGRGHGRGYRLPNDAEEPSTEGGAAHHATTDQYPLTKALPGLAGIEAPFGPGGPAMITDADTNRSHGIVSALSRPSCRAAGGLRRPPESRAFPTSKLTIYLDDASCFEPSQRTLDIDYSMMRGRIGDPKTSAPISGIRGRGPYPE
ncbi:hypothetical protein THAOC_28876, partial [Thalassiosira oceanica]